MAGVYNFLLTLFTANKASCQITILIKKSKITHFICGVGTYDYDALMRRQDVRRLFGGPDNDHI
jgi:hypothetical protein